MHLMSKGPIYHRLSQAEYSFVELYQDPALPDEWIARLRERKFTLSGVYNRAYGSGRDLVSSSYSGREVQGSEIQGWRIRELPCS